MTEIISIISIILLLSLVIVILIKKPEKIDKNLLWFYIPLFFIGLFLHLYALIQTKEYPIYYSIAYAIIASIKMFAFSMEDIILADIVLSSNLYAVAVTLLYLIASFGTFLLIFIVFSKQVKNVIRLYLIKRTPHYLVIGSNKNAVILAKNLGYQTIIMIDSHETEKFKELIHNDIVTIKTKINETTINKAVNNRFTQIVVLQDNDLKNLEIALLLEKLNYKFFKGFINYEEDEKTEVFQITERTKGQITFFSLKQLCAELFSLDNSLFKDFNQSTPQDFKAFFFGFGSINKKLLKQTIINTQMGDMKFSAEVYDKKMKEEKEYFMNQHYGLYELDNLDQQLYYPFPTKPRANCINYHEDDIFSYSFKQQLLTSLTEYNVLFISLGLDKTNFEFALEIDRFLTLHQQTNYKIYVYLKNDETYQLTYLFNDKIIAFGNEKAVLTKGILIDQNLDLLAKRVNGLYWGCDLLNDSHESVEQINELWNKLNYFEKESNRYVVYHINTKLHLLNLQLGYDHALTSDDYLHILTEEKRIQLAKVEHDRWNAFYLMNNYLPMPKVLVKYRDDRIIRKDIPQKIHACITTYEGLYTLTNDSINLLPKDKSKEKIYSMTDIIESDYLVMDHLFELLDGTNIVIQKKGEK